MDKIKYIQKKLIENQIAAYIIPTSDEHNSEYLSDYYKIRAFLSGFTGSAGTLIITPKTALLWTDGRYYIQASKQIEGNNITLMKQGQPGVLSVEDYISTNLNDGYSIAFDGYLMPTNLVLKILEKKPSLNVISNFNIIDELWEDRPPLPFSFLYKLEEFYSGKTFKEKINAVRNEMYKNNTNCYILSSLEDQAWLYNLRANDISHTPVFLAFTYITDNELSLIHI